MVGLTGLELGLNFFLIAGGLLLALALGLLGALTLVMRLAGLKLRLSLLLDLILITGGLLLALALGLLGALALVVRLTGLKLKLVILLLL